MTNVQALLASVSTINVPFARMTSNAVQETSVMSTSAAKLAVPRTRAANKALSATSTLTLASNVTKTSIAASANSAWATLAKDVQMTANAASTTTATKLTPPASLDVEAMLPAQALSLFARTTSVSNVSPTLIAPTTQSSNSVTEINAQDAPMTINAVPAATAMPVESVQADATPTYNAQLAPIVSQTVANNALPMLTVLTLSSSSASATSALDAQVTLNVLLENSVSSQAPLANSDAQTTPDVPLDTA